MNKEHRLLREYIRETLSEDIKSSLFDVGSSAKGLGSTVAKMFGGDSKTASAPERWFKEFLKGQLDKTGKAISTALASKLDELLPDEVKKAIEKKKSAKPSGSSGSEYDELAKVINAFIKSAEKKAGQSLAEDKVNEITDFAAQEYAKAMKVAPDQRKALRQVQVALVAKYSAKIPNEKNK